jgi:hypothetical protein
VSFSYIESGKKALQSLFRLGKYFQTGGHINMSGKIIIVNLISILVILGLFGGFEIARAGKQFSRNMQAIQGSWVRTDGHYLIEIHRGQDGSLQAKYFNPQPIHVASTTTREQDGVLSVIVVLQDVNYQGSTYTLAYNRDKDMLQGTYLHGGSGQLYAVEFTRRADQ